MPFSSGIIRTSSQPLEVATDGLKSRISITHNLERTPIVRFLNANGSEGVVSWKEETDSTIIVDGPLPPLGKIIIE